MEAAAPLGGHVRLALLMACACVVGCHEQQSQPREWQISEATCPMDCTCRDTRDEQGNTRTWVTCETQRPCIEGEQLTVTWNGVICTSIKPTPRRER